LTFDDNNRSELDAVVEEAKRELRSLFVKSEEQIKKVGKALKKVVKKEESICEEIKIALKEEIAEGVISTRTIELYCPPEWKRKTKPKQRENEKISFSKQVEEKPQQQQIAATQEGKSVIINETHSNTDAYSISSDGVNHPHDETNQNGFYDNNEGTTDAESKEEPTVTPSLNDGITSPINKTEDLIDIKKILVSHISMPFEDLRRDMAAVFQRTKGVGNIFVNVWVDLATLAVKIEFCGITQQKDVTMTAAGKGILKEA
jgi:hypothetical protein